MKFIKILIHLKNMDLTPTPEQIEHLTTVRIKLREKIFPILNKIDYIWEKNPELQFCEIVKKINIDDIKNDLELTKRLDEIVDEIKSETNT